MSEPERRGPRFDWTINFGHILTFVGFIASGFALYATLNSRIQRIEDMTPFVQSARDATEARFQLQMQGLSSDVKEVKASVDKLSLSVQVQREVINATKGSK